MKIQEPSCLTQHRLQAHATYANLPEPCKQNTRESLVREQRGLCCYCMGRITASSNSMKIEHWACQNGSRRDLQYDNLLGACLGGEGQPGKLQHCDTKKGNLDLRYNPAKPSDMIESRIRYEIDGAIRSNDDEFDEQLCAVLNLNISWLKANRKAVLDAVIAWWKNEKGRRRGPVSKASFQQERNRYAPAGGELTPYCQVAAWWLDQRLSKMKP